MLQEGVSLSSLLVYNENYPCVSSGYVVNVSVRFCEVFQAATVHGGLLWLFVVGPIGIRNRYGVQPSPTSLLQTFVIPYGELLICGSEYLSIGTYTHNETSTNTACLLETGNYFSSVINYDNITSINSTWNGQQYGVAVNYVVQTNSKEISLIQTYSS